MLWRVLEHPIPAIVVERVERQTLEPAPAKRKDERVICFQDSLVPSVFFNANLDEPIVLFGVEETTQNNREVGIKVLDELTGNFFDLNADVLA
jgi:hypothetical protein